MIDRGAVSKRKKGPPIALRARYGHTPLSLGEDIPWECERLVIDSGAAGSLPVVDDFAEEADREGVELLVLPTSKAIVELEQAPDGTNAILHVTC